MFREISDLLSRLASRVFLGNRSLISNALRLVLLAADHWLLFTSAC